MAGRSPPSATSWALLRRPGWSGGLPNAALTVASLPTIGMMALGNVVIYAFGVAGLMLIAHMSLGKALALGVLPFLIGDVIKILLAAVLLPGTWKLINSRKGS